MEDGGEFCSVDLENELAHLHGGWRRILLCRFGGPSAWRMEENFALLIWSSICMEDGGEICSVDLEVHLHGGWRMEENAACSVGLENELLHLLGGWRRILL